MEPKCQKKGIDSIREIPSLILEGLTGADMKYWLGGFNGTLQQKLEASNLANWKSRIPDDCKEETNILSPIFNLKDDEGNYLPNDLIFVKKCKYYVRTKNCNYEFGVAVTPNTRDNDKYPCETPCVKYPLKCFLNNCCESNIDGTNRLVYCNKCEHIETGIFAYNLLEIIKQIIVQKCYSQKFQETYDVTRNLGITVYDPVTQLPFTQNEIKEFQDMFIKGVENIKRKSTLSNKLMVLANTLWLVTMVANIVVSTCNPDDPNAVCQNTTNAEIEANREFYSALPQQAINFMQNIMHTLYIGATTNRIYEIWKTDSHHNYTLKTVKTIKSAITGMYLTGSLKYLNKIIKTPLPKLEIGYQIPDAYLEYARTFVSITPENDSLNLENMPRFLDYGGTAASLINILLGDKNDVDEMSKRIKRMKGRRFKKQRKKLKDVINRRTRIFENLMFLYYTGDSINLKKAKLVERAYVDGDPNKQHLFDEDLNDMILKVQKIRSVSLKLTNENLSSSEQINKLFSYCSEIRKKRATKKMRGGNNLYSAIVNPLTGRKVSIFGKIGKNIIRNYINQIEKM